MNKVHDMYRTMYNMILINYQVYLDSIMREIVSQIIVRLLSG